MTLDGSTGEVFGEAITLIPPSINDDFQRVVLWADEVRTLGVRANADNFEDASKARELGAEGIGLCRTEHMFLVPERLPAVREMIIADTTEKRATALEKILPMQQEDFEAIFTAMKGLPGHRPAARPAAARIPARPRRAEPAGAEARTHRRRPGRDRA